MKPVRRGSGRFCQLQKHDPYSVVSGKRIVNAAERRARARVVFAVISIAFLATGIFFMFF